MAGQIYKVCENVAQHPKNMPNKIGGNVGSVIG